MKFVSKFSNNISKIFSWSQRKKNHKSLMIGSKKKKKISNFFSWLGEGSADLKYYGNCQLVERKLGNLSFNQGKIK